MSPQNCSLILCQHLFSYALVPAHQIYIDRGEHLTMTSDNSLRPTRAVRPWRASMLAAMVGVAPLIGATALVGIPSAAEAQIGFGVGISVNVGPPALPVYVQPAIPGPDYIWQPGYWGWNADASDYYWVPGTWVLAPRPGLLWTPGYWGWGGGAYAFHDGYWGQSIGYYGGISYGFGYTGIGYAGGYWNNNHFMYNRSVNNINSNNTNITNVYNKTVINNNNASHASFNGPGGVTARPTQQELAVAHQQHFAPTAVQQQHAKMAAAEPTLRASANHGLPPVAATAHPAAFHGPGVVGAAKAGSPTPYHATSTLAHGAGGGAGHPQGTQQSLATHGATGGGGAGHPQQSFAQHGGQTQSSTHGAGGGGGAGHPANQQFNAQHGGQTQSHGAGGGGGAGHPQQSFAQHGGGPGPGHPPGPGAPHGPPPHPGGPPHPANHQQ
jgi:hypothetical protein